MIDLDNLEAAINDKAVTVVVCIIPNKAGNKVDAYIPDLKVTVHAKSLVDAMMRANTLLDAVYYYNMERDTPIAIKTTYAKALKMCKTPGAFVTHIALSNG